MSDKQQQSPPRICFVSKPSPQRYKTLDIEILSRHFDLVPHDYTYSLPNFIQFLGKLRKADVVFSWFASPWMAVAQFFIPRRIKLIIVAGGYDVANCEELKHGARFHPVRSFLTRHLLRQADVVLPVSMFNSRELLTLVKPKSCQTVYNAVDMPAFSVIKGAVRPKKILTVGVIGSFISKCKGHYRFLDVAAKLPQFEFVLIGKAMDSTVDHLKSIAPENVKILDYEGRDQLLQQMLSSSVYLQLSYYESFGVSVAEAIVCGCYPIVSRDTALPEIICGMGEVVKADDLNLVAYSVNQAIQKEKYKLIDPEPVRQLFSVKEREQKLTSIINHVFKEST